MRDDDHQEERSEEQPESQTPSMPASVIFMEMMRRAAADAHPPEPEPQAAIDVAPEVEDKPTRPEKGKKPTKPPLTEEERRQAAAMEAQRLRRVKRRREKRRTRNASVLGGIVRSFIVVIVSAALMATILSWWTSSDFLQPEMRRNLQVAISTNQATVMPTVAVTPNYLRKIGIVAGHRGPGRVGDVEYTYDPGAICEDIDLREVDINFNVATLVVNMLRERGYRAELLDEFDPRLNDYQAATLLSIHANDCSDYGEAGTGFIVAKAASKPEGGVDTQLAECIARHYEPVTGLGRRTTLTLDMTDYHSFREIHPLTPAAIIELGFMRNDQELLTERPDLLARGIVDGIMCFMEPEDMLYNVPETDVTPEPET